MPSRNFRYSALSLLLRYGDPIEGENSTRVGTVQAIDFRFSSIDFVKKLIRFDAFDHQQKLKSRPVLSSPTTLAWIFWPMRSFCINVDRDNALFVGSLSIGDTGQILRSVRTLPATESATAMPLQSEAIEESFPGRAGLGANDSVRGGTEVARSGVGADREG